MDWKQKLDLVAAKAEVDEVWAVQRMGNCGRMYDRSANKGFG